MSNENKKNIVHIDADLEEIIPRFMEIRQEDIEQIREALGKGDLEIITRIGHSMKGAGGSYGFDRVSELGAAIEIAGKENKIDEIEGLLDELTRYMENVEIVYDEE